MACKHPVRVIVKRRCDVPMRLSKLKARQFECLGNCKSCVCCIEMDAYGNEEHVSLTSRVTKREREW